MNTEQKITLLRKARAKVIGASADLAELGFGGKNITTQTYMENNMDDYYTWKEKEDDKVYEQFLKELENEV
jgi:hypothetical protein